MKDKITPNQLCEMPWFPRSSVNTVKRYIKKGFIKADKVKIVNKYYYLISKEEVDRLRKLFTSRYQ